MLLVSKEFRGEGAVTGFFRTHCLCIFSEIFLDLLATTSRQVIIFKPYLLLIGRNLILFRSNVFLPTLYFHVHTEVQDNRRTFHHEFSRMLFDSNRIPQVDLLGHTTFLAIDVEGHFELDLLALVEAGLRVVRYRGE